MATNKNNNTKRTNNKLPLLDFNNLQSANFDFAASSIFPLLNYFPPSISLKDTNLRYILANKSTLKRFGLSSEEEIIGKTDDAFFNQNFSETVKNQEQKIIETALPIIEFEQTEQWFDDSVTYSLVTKIPIKDVDGKVSGILSIVTDITKQKEVENAFGDNLKFLEVLVNTLPISIFYTDENKIFQGCNDDFCGLTMKDRSDIIGMKPENIFSEKSCEILNHHFNSLIQNDKVQTFEITLEMKNGKTVETIIQQANFKNFDNKIVGLIGCIIDIHNQKTTERKLESYADELKKINSSKDKFFSIIAHDLKNPFITLLGLTEALLEDYYEMEDEEILEYISQLRKTSKSTYQLLENLLQWSRSQTGRLKYEPSRFNLYSITEEILSQISSQSLSKKIKIHNAFSPDTLVFADREMIKTVLRNLITNAIKFTPEEGKITLQDSANDRSMIIEVRDTGMGIQEDLLPNMFSIDRNYSSPGTKNEEGTGLGLILCKEFIEKNGGEIWVESKFGEGSTFSFTLPIENVE